MPQRGENRVRRRLTKAAERSVSDLVAELLHLIEHLHRAVAFSDLGEHLKESLGSDTARCALAAGLVTDEFHIELGYVDHTVVLIEDDHTAGALRRTDRPSGLP